MVITSLMILLPVLAGLVLWNRLPDTMFLHWGVEGVVDGAGPRWFAVFVPYLIVLALHWFCILFTLKDPGNENQSEKAIGLLYWILPMFSILMGCAAYCSAFGWELNTSALTIPFIGLVFLLFGNYLPKTKQNMTFGIKLPWTIRNEENWNKTHRFGGKVWVIGGFILMLSIFLPIQQMVTVMMIDILAVVLLPTAYSYLLYRKQKAAGDWSMEGKLTGNPMYDRQTKFSTIFVIGTLVFVGILMFTGDLEYEYGEESFSIETTYWNDFSLYYDKIVTLSYRDDIEGGLRTNGFGSLRLAMGIFENDEFGTYTRYTYGSCDEAVVIETERSIIVLNDKDEKATRMIYDELSSRILKEY